MRKMCDVLVTLTHTPETPLYDWSS